MIELAALLPEHDLSRSICQKADSRGVLVTGAARHE
jgi:hypothetical protein